MLPMTSMDRQVVAPLAPESAFCSGPGSEGLPPSISTKPISTATMHGCVASFLSTLFPSVRVNRDNPADHITTRWGISRTEVSSVPIAPYTPPMIGMPRKPALEQTVA